jgi:acetate kinase
VAGLGGLDALVFTGGIGEGSTRVRELTTARLQWLGVRIADVPIDGDVVELTASEGSVRTFIVQAREDLEMARLVSALD